jgi:hypothetical protein
MCYNEKERKKFNARGKERELQHQGERERTSMLGKEKELQC